jgi:hypothetical protein
VKYLKACRQIYLEVESCGRTGPVFARQNHCRSLILIKPRHHNLQNIEMPSEGAWVTLLANTWTKHMALSGVLLLNFEVVQIRLDRSCDNQLGRCIDLKSIEMPSDDHPLRTFTFWRVTEILTRSALVLSIAQPMPCLIAWYKSNPGTEF